MTTNQPNEESRHISDETQRAVRVFVRTAVSRLLEALKDQETEWELELRWERGTDGNFREHTKSTQRLWAIMNSEWLQSLPDYDSCVEHLKSDKVVGPHLDRLVGTKSAASRLEADNILRSEIHAMVNEEGSLVFTDQRFDDKWQEIAELLYAQQIPEKMVAPLPHLSTPYFPLRLNEELVLDRLTDDEVTRCCHVGVLRPPSLRFPLINAETAVGIRRVTLFAKTIHADSEPYGPPESAAEGSFGKRPNCDDSVVVDDVLSALRLFKHTEIRSAGYASWVDTPWLRSGIQYRILRQWPYGGSVELSEAEVPQFVELWRLLEEGATRFEFSIRRFNVAFDRGLLTDRIVDLVIAAESLFLGDVDLHYRGELRFRCALRAANFIEHSKYNQQQVFRLMLRAYDARSAIVHGGSPKDIRLPDDNSASLSIFIDAIEELVRLGLRKALSMKQKGAKLRQSQYWDDLMFTTSRMSPVTEEGTYDEETKMLAQEQEFIGGGRPES